MPAIGLLSGHASDEIPPVHLDLVECPPAAALTTVTPDGYPQTSVVWCDCYDPREPLRYLEMRGTVVEIAEVGAAEHLDDLASKHACRPIRCFRSPPRTSIS